MKNEEMKNKAVSPEELSEDALNDISGGIRITHNIACLTTGDPITDYKMQSLTKVVYHINQVYNGDIQIEEYITEVLSENAANAWTYQSDF